MRTRLHGLTFAFLAAMQALSGCCTEMDCVGTALPRELYSARRDSLTLASTRIEVLDRQTGQLLDTVSVTQVRRTADRPGYRASFYTIYQEEFAIKRPKQLRLTAPGQDTVLITDILYANHNCNECYPGWLEGDGVRSYSGYVRNGRSFQSATIDLD